MISYNDYKLNNIVSIIDTEIKTLNLIVAGFPDIADKLKVGSLASELKRTFLYQLNRANPNDEEVIALKSKFPVRHVLFKHSIEEDINTFMDDLRNSKLEISKFKNKYINWARSFISKLKIIKEHSDCSWFNVRPFAEILTQLEISESKKVDDMNDIEKQKEINALVNGILENMLYDVGTGEVESHLVRDYSDSYTGTVTNRTYHNTFPTWYREIGVNGKADFEKVVKAKSGVRYKRVLAKAKDILENGYADEHRQYPPDDFYRKLVGLEELGHWDSSQPNSYNGKSYEDDNEDKEDYSEVPF